LRRISWLLFVALALAGCGSSAPPAAQETGAIVTPVTEPPKKPLDSPNFDSESRLILQRGNTGVKVGSSYDDAVSVFAAPTGWWPRDDLPPSVTPPFDARGWQTKGEGFGSILYKGRIAAAVYELDRTNSDRLDEILEWQQRANGSAWTMLDGKYVRYWFWQSGTRENRGDQILMVCATEIQPRKFNVTAAIGTIPVMSALSMTPETASRDQKTAEKLFEKQKAAARSNSSNSPNQDGH
jgi:hypothetical protein